MASVRANCRKIVCIGRNYAEHIAELNNAAPRQPFFFLKPPSSILAPGAGPVLRPKGVSLHYEIELGLIMGREVKDLDPRDEKGALDAIESYVLAIDMTARDVQNEAKRKGLPWSIAKGFDTFLPISKQIPKRLIPDPHNAFLRLSISSGSKTLAESTTRPVQADSTGLMLYRIPRQLADISRVMTLEKGDVVLTGTPKGVGEVSPGEVMTGWLEVDGKEVSEGRIEVGVEERVHGRFDNSET